MENLEQKRLGLRIKSARILTGLNQEEFAKACDLNYTSLRNWEFGRVAPRKNAIDRLIESFRSFSIFIDRDWIFFGKGQGPVFTANESLTDFTPIWREEINVFKKTCSAIGERPLILNIEDEDMAPFYRKGDSIGAVVKSLSSLDNYPNCTELLAKPMLVKLTDRQYYLRNIYLRDGEWLAKGNNSYRLTKIIGDLVGVVVLHISSTLNIDAI
jgi:transcriptional regulator with XRE-family HTH domain